MATRGKGLNLGKAISDAMLRIRQQKLQQNFMAERLSAHLRFGLKNVPFDRKTVGGLKGHEYTGSLSKSIKSVYRSTKKVGRSPKGDGVSYFHVAFGTMMNPYGFTLDEGRAAGEKAGQATKKELIAWINAKYAGKRGRIDNPEIYWDTFAERIIRNWNVNGMKGTSWMQYGLDNDRNDDISLQEIGVDVKLKMEQEVVEFFRSMGFEVVK